MQPKNFTEAHLPWRPVACSDAEARLWLVDVAADPAALADPTLALSKDEMERANRFHCAEDRARFMRTRSALRHLLAEATGQKPQTLTFSLGPFGKPSLVDGEDSRRPNLHFNASHSGALALIGISRSRPIGVDIELMHPNIDELALAETVFCGGERRFLKSLEGPARLEAFHRIWTCKEAVLKAFGVGVTAYLKDFEVRLGPERIDLEPAPGCFTPALAAVRVSRVDAPAGYAAACALA